MTPKIEDFLLNQVNVSRETIQELETYVDQLIKWNRQINLVSNASLNDIWNRHIMDSAQVLTGPALSANSWTDLGSGAGFPGLVVAILAKGRGQNLNVTLVESDGRKCEFLRHIARLTNTQVTVENSRIEHTILAKADIVSARALSHLSELLGYASSLLKADGYCLFLKGSNVDAELTEAASIWHIDYTKIPSVSDSNGVILQVRNIRHV